MSGILDLLNSDLGKQLISGASSEANTSPNQTAGILQAAIPLLGAAMQKNAQQPQAAEGLLNALKDKRHDGSLLDNLGGYFGGGVDESAKMDGAKILGHLLGNKQSTVEHAISQKTGVSSSSIAQILKVAAPVLMAYMGKQARQNNVSSTNGLEGVLGSLFGDSSKNTSLLTALLDSNGDGSIIDDIAGMALGGNKNSKSGGLGGMLGGLFKR
ncbi:MAG: DUF937 domain-containing protein [Flavobacteriaceae bacterium]|nr:DUF937 domain-containing protein [Flavobacteriaceae bacterium]